LDAKVQIITYCAIFGYFIVQNTELLLCIIRVFYRALFFFYVRFV